MYFHAVLRGADPAGLDRLALEVARAADGLDAIRRSLPVWVGEATAAGIADVERWLRRQESDLRCRHRALGEPDITLIGPSAHAAGVMLTGAGRTLEWGGRGVLALGVEFERYTASTAGMVADAGGEIARQAGPLRAMVEDRTTLASATIASAGEHVLRSAQAESYLLRAAGEELERAGSRVYRLFSG